MKTTLIFCVFVLTELIAIGQGSFIRFDDNYDDHRDTIRIEDFTKVKKLFVDVEYFKILEYQVSYLEDSTVKEIPVYTDTLPEMIKKGLYENTDALLYRIIYIDDIKVEDIEGRVRKVPNRFFVIKY